MSGDVAGLEKAGGRSWPEPPGKEGAGRMWKEREKPPEDGVWQVPCLQGGFAVHPVAGAVAKVACRSCLSGYGRIFPVVIISRSICFFPGVPVSAGGLFRQCFPVQNVPEGGRVFSGGRMG